MNRFTYTFFVLAFLFVFSCRENEVIYDDFSFNEPFQLNVGQSKILKPDNLEVGFQSALNDSRCPTGAVCKWEGMAHLRLWLRKSGLDSTFLKAQIRGYVMKEDTCCHLSKDTLGYRVTVLQLDPYPDLDSIFQPIEYKALLAVQRL